MEASMKQIPNRDDELERKRQKNTTAILRVFNYYRVLLSFALLLLFLQVPGQQFVGNSAPQLFQPTILIYIGINVLVSLLSLVLSGKIVSRKDFISSILVIDIIILTLLMFASGGIASGLGNFLIFPVAFAGVLARGRFSVAVAAIAVILAFYAECNLMLVHGNISGDHLFQVGLLGIALFAVNLLFQYLAVQLRRKEAEVTTLHRLNEMRLIAEEARLQLDTSNARLEVLLHSAGDGILGLDMDGAITFANPKAAELLRSPAETLVGENIDKFAFRDETTDNGTRFHGYSLLHRLDQRSHSISESWSWARWDGERFTADYSCEATLDHNGTPNGAVVIFQDATPRREMEEKLNYLANFDSLTDLVNRGYFQSTLEQAVARCTRSGGNLAVLLLDLDHFKCINDQYGHDFGDELLKQVAARMNGCIRQGDTAARLGGDEFAIALLDFNSPENVGLVARNLVDEISKPYQIMGKQLNVSTSIGIALLHPAVATSSELMKNADIAMYVSKSEGRNTWRFFAPHMLAEAESIQRIQMALNNALEQDEFVMHYQPVVSMTDRTVHHAEALIRWNPRGEDPISPDIFIPIAEETGKINEIGSWVLLHVFKQVAAWRDHYGQCPRVAINVSTKQLASSHFRELTRRYLAQYAIPPSAIDLELTETGVMDDPETVREELEALHDMGIHISVDDFGTGYSSLDYLRRLPIDQVKIDKSFTQRISESEHDREIIRVILAIARTLNLTVVAEGIETEEQLQFLLDNDCDFGQGLLFSAALDAVSMSDVIEQGLAVTSRHRQADNITRLSEKRRRMEACLH